MTCYLTQTLVRKLQLLVVEIFVLTIMTRI